MRKMEIMLKSMNSLAFCVNALHVYVSYANEANDDGSDVFVDDFVIVVSLAALT